MIHGIAKGTLVQSNKGIIKIEDFGRARDNNEFNLVNDDFFVADKEGSWKAATSHYAHEKTDTIKIRFTNGNIIECSNDEKFIINNESTMANKIKKGDSLLGRRFIYAEEYNNLYKSSILNTLAKSDDKVTIPRNMTYDLAFLIGIILNRDSILKVSENKFVFMSSDYSINDRFLSLVRNIFLTKQLVVKLDNIYCNVYSEEIVKFLKSLGCLDKNNLFIPRSIINGDKDIQMSFINGLLISKERIKNNNVCIYTGFSDIMCYQLFSMLCGFGFSPNIYKKNTLSRLSKNISINVDEKFFLNDQSLKSIRNHLKYENYTVSNISYGKSELYNISVNNSDNYLINNVIVGDRKE